MNEIGDELNDKPENNDPVEEPSELTNESDDLKEINDDLPEIFGEYDEIDTELPEIFGEDDEIDTDLPEIFGENDEFDDDLPEIFGENDELDDDLPEIFGEPVEGDGDLPEIFGEAAEIDDDLPEIFDETSEGNDILNNAIHDKEDGELSDEDQDSGDAGNIYENIGSESTTTVLTSEAKEIKEMKSPMEPQEQEEEIEIPPEEYQGDSEPIVNTEEIEFINKIEELAEFARETKGEEEVLEPQVEENAAYHAEKYYENLKEKEEVHEQFSKEDQEIEESRQEVTEESENLEEINETSKEITSTEEFEYLWNVREGLDQEGKFDEEIKEVMQEAEEMYKTLKEAEKLFEEQQQEILKQVNHEDEASVEDLKEDLDRVDLIEQAVELEQILVQQERSQEEINMEVEEAIEETIETSEFGETIEKLYEEQEMKKSKLADLEDEESVVILKEDLDRVDLIEQAVELEENLVQQERSQEEIDTKVEEAIEETIEMSEFGETLKQLHEEQETKKAKLADLEDEESIENVKEDLDRIDLIEQSVELEQVLVQQGKSQEEIDLKVEEAIEKIELEEELENLIEKEQNSLRKHEAEEESNEAREEIDRPAEAEYYMESEEELHRQGMLQEEIDEQMEEIASNYQNEINKKQEPKQEPKGSEKHEKHDLETNQQNLSVEQGDYIEQTSTLHNEKKTETYENVENKEKLEVVKPELDAIKSESEDKKELLEERTKLASEEEEEKYFQELYHQETGKRPFYAKKRTKGYIQWLEQQKLGSEKINKSLSESELKKEIEEEDWKTTLKQWIKEASEDECNTELKSELKKAIESYNEFEVLTRKFFELYKKAQREKLSEQEKSRMASLLEKLQEFDPIQLELLANVRAIKKYIVEQYAWDSMNRFRDYRVRNKFFKHISQKYENLKLQLLKLKELINSNTKKNLMNQRSKSGETVRIFKFRPAVLVKIIEQLGGNLNVILDIKDETYLQKKKNYTYSSRYSDGDVEFWIELYKVKYYGQSWPAVFNFINECNNRFNLKIDISNYYNDIIPIVKTYFKQNSLNYEEFLIKYGIRKSKQPPTDETVHDWIKIYQDRELGGSISAIRKHLENLQGYTLGETTIRRHIKKFFLNGKYTDYFGTVLSYEEWIKIYKRKYFREVMPLDPKTQSHEYILLYNTKNNRYKRVFIKDLENPELLENIDELQILGISNNLQPEKVNISQFEKKDLQKSLEIVCSHGSVMISPKQYLYTIDDDCNIIEIKGCDLKVGTPILMPRIFKINSNDEPIDLINCGKLITSSTTQYIEQFGKKAYRFIKKNANLGAIIGQYAAEGTMPSRYQPGTTISVSVDKDYIQKLQKIIKEVFGLEFQIFARRVTECKNCGSKTIEKGNQNICPKCEDGIYNECYELRTKTKLAKTIFTEGLGLKHTYSYLKEIPSFLYNSPTDCEKGFILSYFKGDGSELDYRNKGGTFELNFVTTSRRLVFGLNLLMKKLGVIMSVRAHKPSNRPNSKKLYQMSIRGSSNFELLKHHFENLPEIDYTTSDIRTSVNNQILMRKLNLELQKMYDISLRELSNRGIIPKNAQHIATQLKRKTNLSEVLLLKTLDGLRNEELMTPLVKKLEQVFRKNTFTRIKKIRSSKTNNQTYKIVVDGIGYCSGTAFVYVKSKDNK